jgi:hypothetical protein
MIEVSIIVQLREVTEDGRKGRCAIGVAKLQSPTATPQKSWGRYFEDASRRALTQRHAQLEGLHTAAPRDPQLSLQFQAADPRRRSPRRSPRPKFTGQVQEE